MKWTPEQDDYLIAHAHEGAESVQKGMFRTFGKLRSTSAIISHGTRIGASWARWVECPRCGAKVKKLNYRTKICHDCTRKYLAAESARIREQIESMQDKEAIKEYEREKKRLQRARGKFADMNKKMPNASSGQESF